MEQKIIIYQFHLMSDGEIKTSSCEYKRDEDYSGTVYYKKVKTLTKGVHYPKFPVKLYKLGRAEHCKYYALDEKDIKKFAYEVLCETNETLRSLEFQLKKYLELEFALNDYLK